MLTAEENRILTETGRGTPLGEMMRRYWQPVALSEELPPGGAPLPVKLLGEELVLFRDDEGKPGLLGLHCSHRGADLSYGRVEDGGLRCIYHGWLYDRSGRCVEQPGEPAGSTYHERIRQTAYPCVEAGGMVLAYLGPGEPPLLPSFDFFKVPVDNVFIAKLYADCNFMQGHEGNIDLLHTSFLHFSPRDIHTTRPSENGNGAAHVQLSSRGGAPHAETVEAQLTESGLRIAKVRKLSPEENHVRVATFVLPGFTAVPGGQVNWHVPIDDTHHWKYTLIFTREGPIDRDQAGRDRLDQAPPPSYMPVLNKANRYQQDRASMNTATYCGIPVNRFQIQDLCVWEGAGSIQDRTNEHLVPSDVAIVASRKVYAAAIKDVADGRDPPGVIREPEKNEFKEVVANFADLPSSTSWKDYCKQLMANGEAWQARGQG